MTPPAPAEGHSDAREQFIRTAYDLFSRHGLTGVGVDRIVAETGFSKTSLYRHFRSKDDLVVAVLERHELLWIEGWLVPTTGRLARSPQHRFLVIFDLFLDWFGQPGFQGCLFTNSLLETHDRSSPVRTAAIRGLDHVYDVLVGMAKEAKLRDPKRFAHQMQVLMRGSFVAGVQGRLDAVQQARAGAEQLLAGALVD
jgi:AcrR family transcriptional regulator